ncbi:hypothetical protein HPP92_011158 [Vanilla planifolia]|uniref:C3H1-type domain-containing protein n=1 Tax=Vanilla planifolia TaxID=51239 RepID=A0A835R6I3_VANPL|nr:hypothetical protein HPP92_011158 [Vanilla planifolia]
MADPLTGGGSPDPAATVGQSRKEKRRVLKKLKRKQIRKETAIREREEEKALVNDPEVQIQLLLVEKEAVESREGEEGVRGARGYGSRRVRPERKRTSCEESCYLRRKSGRRYNQCTDDFKDNEEYEYVEGPAEIIWQGNEIIVKKKRTKIAKKSSEQIPGVEDDNRPTSNPLPPQSAAFASYVQGQTATSKELLESVAQQVPNFGTEQDKAHCPFHLKTGACRFGSRCSRVHFYPDTSCTLLVKNMYNGPGLACEQDEGLEVCKNSSYHLRGNVYVHYKHLDSAILAYNTMNARYYAGKQIICEFVGVTRWKVAICGEYMKSRLKTCSHGSACNFIHCFRNPGGDYEWADWDNPPPRNWIKKMAVLFGPSVELDYQKELESGDFEKNSDKIRMTKHRSRRYLS